MADQQYYSLFTKQGLTLLTEAINKGTKLGISHMAFGDGGGSLPVPNDEFTELVNEVYRMQINSLAPDPNNANWLRAEAVIPSAVGGFNIRELGLYAGNVLVAYSNYPPTTKPAPGDGAAQIKSFRMILQIDNVANFELVIDPDVVLATITLVNDIKTELYENTVSKVETIQDLKALNVFDGRKVKCNFYESTNDVRAGGEFYYDASDSSSEIDNIFVFESEKSTGRWKRIIENNTINILQAGLTGLGDEGNLLNNLLIATANQSSNLNYSRKIVIDGLNMRINTSKQINLNLTLCDMKNITIISNIPAQTKLNKNTGCGLYVFGSDAWTTNPVTYRRKGHEVLSKVSIFGNKNANTLGLYLEPSYEGNFANCSFDQIEVKGFTHNLIFTSNCYLMSFYNCSFLGATSYILATSKYIGIDQELLNMGENIRFFSCAFSDSDKVSYLDHQMWISYYSCSFDYCGKSSDTTGWFKTTVDVGQTFYNCHFESGNENNQIGFCLFETTDSRSFYTLLGGTMVFGGTLNACEYVFYSTAPENFNFSVENVNVFASTASFAKKGWANTGMGRFRVFGNTTASSEVICCPTVLSPNKSLTRDYNFEKSTVLGKVYEKWWGTSGISIALGTTTNEQGVVVPCLNANITAAEQSLFLLIERKRLKDNRSASLLLKAKLSKDAKIYYRLLPVDILSDQVNAEIPLYSVERYKQVSLYGFFNPSSLEANILTTMDYFSSSRAVPTLEKFDHYLLQINFSTVSDALFSVTSVEVYEPDL